MIRDFFIKKYIIFTLFTYIILYILYIKIIAHIFQSKCIKCKNIYCFKLQINGRNGIKKLNISKGKVLMNYLI